MSETSVGASCLQRLVEVVDSLYGAHGPATTFLAHDAASEALRERLLGAAEWAAQRAAADVELLEALVGTEKLDLGLSSIGRRWLLLHGLGPGTPAKVCAERDLSTMVNQPRVGLTRETCRA
jgi:hypothetical protein